MDLIEFRDYCLSLGDIDEKTPFGKFSKRYDSVLVFYVSGHMFCIIDMDDFTYVDIPLSAERIAYLRETYASVSTPLNRGLRYWIQINFDGDIPDDIIYKSVREACDSIKAKYTHKSKNRCK